MLVLTRKYQEKVRIGDNITITVLRTKGKTVRLGIEAPSDVPVIRGELAFEPAAATVSPEGTETSSSEQRTARRNLSSASAWSADCPRRTESVRVVPLTTQVDLRRVPRDKVTQVLPQLVAGKAPLRAMMERS